MPMKAIIVDDEKHVREGLILLADWAVHGIDTVMEAEDGEEAVELIQKHRPEIIFTDMRMPKRDGISLLKWIHTAGIRSKTIVVSGHDDFELMRNAIHYKSFDYLLKPIEPDILNETLERAVKEWRDHRRSEAEEKQAMNEVKPRYWDHLLSTLCRQSFVPPSAEKEFLKEHGRSLVDCEKRIAIFSVKPMMRHVFQGDLELTVFTVMNICNEWLRSKDIGVCFRHTHSDDEIAILLWDIDDAESRLRQLTERIYQYSSVQITMAIGTISTRMHEAYQAALAIHYGKDLTGKAAVVSKIERKSEPPHLFDYAAELKLLVQAGDKDKLSSKVLMIMDALSKKEGLTLARLKEWDDQFSLLRSNWLKEYGISLERKPVESDYWGRDGSFLVDRFKEDKRKDFLELIDCLSNIRYQKEKNPMQEVEQFLMKHYVEEVSLQEIADRFYLSREYISRRFKQEYGVTITDYLTSIRVEKAKQLLSNPYVKIYQVAHDVGFQNEKYFSKVFKKHTGETPAQFRQSLAQRQMEGIE